MQRISEMQVHSPPEIIGQYFVSGHFNKTLKRKTPLDIFCFPAYNKHRTEQQGRWRKPAENPRHAAGVPYT